MVFFALFACSTNTDSGAADSAPPAPTVATLSLSFQMDGDLIENMSEPPVGIFRGSVYAEDQASPVGPVEGAVSLLDFESGEIDLSVAGGPSEVAFAGGELDAQVIWVLGCLDSDANECECDDPITVPNDNKVGIVLGDNPITVKMELLHPC